MKQTKTTLILGVLLAIIVIVIVGFEIKNKPSTQHNAKIENAMVLPVVKKIGDSALSILISISKTIFVSAKYLEK